MQHDHFAHDANMETLRGLNEDYIRSVATQDVARFEQLLAGDFLNSNPDGTLSDRAEFLARLPRLGAISNLRCEDVRIRILGDVAIVHGRTTYTKPDGQPGAGRYTDVWALQGAHWQCVAAHVTRG